MDRILIILKKENRSRASSALTLGLNTIILKHVYWYTYMQQISGERLQDHWSSGSLYHELFSDRSIVLDITWDYTMAWYPAQNSAINSVLLCHELTPTTHAGIGP